MLTLKEEKRLWKKGYKYVVCLDEAGRGALCGPVVAAAVMVKKFSISEPASWRAKGKKRYSSSPFNFRARQLAGEGKEEVFLFALQFSKIKDSKKLTPKRRAEFYKILTRHQAIKWGIGRVSEKVIDKINILEATKLAMKKAIKKLKRKPDFLILDGNFTINSPILQKSIIKADEKVFSCTLSGIIAKVTRDGIMQNCHKKYPCYGFDKHKGYPTKYHLKMLKKYGPCKIHRKSFKPLWGQLYFSLFT